MPEKTAETLDAEVHWHDYGLLFWECNIQFNPFQHFVARWPVAVHFMVKMTYWYIWTILNIGLGTETHRFPTRWCLSLSRSERRTDVFWGRQILQKNALFKTVHFQYIEVLKNDDFGSNKGYPLSDLFSDIFLDLEKHFVAILVVSWLGSVLAPVATNLLAWLQTFCSYTCRPLHFVAKVC